MDVQKQDNDKNKGDGGAWWQPSLVLFARFSSWVLAPVIMGYLIGSFLSSRFGGGNDLYFLASVGISFIISMFGLVREVGKEYKKIEDSAEEKKKNDKNNNV